MQEQHALLDIFGGVAQEAKRGDGGREQGDMDEDVRRAADLERVREFLVDVGRACERANDTRSTLHDTF